MEHYIPSVALDTQKYIIQYEILYKHTFNIEIINKSVITTKHRKEHLGLSVLLVVFEEKFSDL